MKLYDAVQAYKADRLAKGYATSTVANEQSVLKALYLAIGADRNTQYITAHDMDEFWKRRQYLKPGSLNRDKAYLSSFFKWLQIRGWMARGFNPLEGVRNRPVMPRDHVLIPVEEFPTVLEKAPDARLRAMLALGLYLFVRVSEMRELRWRDIDWKNKVVRIHRQKTNTVDDLPMCEELEHELKLWRLAYGEQAGRVPLAEWYVVPAMAPPKFAGRAGGGALIMTAPAALLPTVRLKNFSKVIKRALACSGYDGLQEGGHTLRRSGATALYQELSKQGHDRAMRTVQAMLGHANLTTTEVYLRLDLDRKARNDLLAGKRMFSGGAEADVIQLREVPRGQENPGAV